ncbi:MAG: formate dehydrogenase subunit gamma [Pseudorhodoplanes sp.]
MTTLLAKSRFIVGALLLLCAVAIAMPAVAQDRNPDGSVNPTASAVNERQLLEQFRQIDGRVTIPNTKAGVLIQPAGQEWRQFHQVTMYWIGAIAIVGMLAILVIFYLARGMVKIQKGRSGRTVVRFNAFERFVHWMTASCFIVLAVSGLNITFGRALLLPLMGPDAFTGWSQWGKYAHNFLSFPFTIGVVLIFLMWIGGNLPNARDAQWISRGGGLFGDDHPPAGRFNLGQKMIYWIVVLGGGAVAITGYILMFPFFGGITIAGMQLAQIVHGVVALLFIAAMLAHIYIGTIGMEGAFEAMGTGEVDVNWAKQHHSIWLEEEMNKNKVGGATPQGAPAE